VLQYPAHYAHLLHPICKCHRLSIQSLKEPDGDLGSGKVDLGVMLIITLFDG